MPAIQEIMSILTASIKKLRFVQWKLISGFANSIRSLAMHPLGLNGVQPRAFTQQPARHNAHALSRLLHPAVMLVQPGTHLVTDVPRGVVPDQQHGGEPLRRQPLTALGEKGGG